MNKILAGIRREDKNKWEGRAPLIPGHVEKLIRDENINFMVQPSGIRTFTEEEYKKAGAFVQEDLSACSVIFGIKEMPLDFFQKNKTYVFFSHTVKGQSYNMPMLKKIMEKGCTLIDYEKIQNEAGKRLIFFGNYAGLAGMLDTLWALGKRLEWEGINNPFSILKQCYEYRDLKEAREAVKEVSMEIEKKGLPQAICPVVCGFAGYGNVSGGAQEICDILPFIKTRPEQLSGLKLRDDISCHHIYKVVFKVKYMAKPVDESMKFKLWHYYKYPHLYEGRFEEFASHLTILINGIYWDKKYARLITKKFLKDRYINNLHLPLKVIGDISCDINGAIEFTEKATTADNPVFVYDPVKDKVIDGYKGRGVVVMSIDNLPGELPKDSSDYFGKILMKFVPEIVKADYSVDFEECELSSPVKNAVIVYQGKLAPNYKYLEKYL